MNKNKTNIAASTRQRLLNQARQQKRPFDELLQYYAMERFLYRLSKSAHAGSFILKGALMLRVWHAPEARPTMDIDLLGRTANQPDAIALLVAEIARTPVTDDGMEYDITQLRTEVITEDADKPSILPFEERFVIDKQRQWKAFHRRLDSPGVPEKLEEVCSVLTEFLGVFTAPGKISNQQWIAPGPWRNQ